MTEMVQKNLLGPLTVRNILLIFGTGILIILLGFLNATLPPLVFVGGVIFILLATLVLRYPLIGVILIAFFLPLERVGAYELGATTVRLSQAFLAVTIVAWALYMLMRKRAAWSFNNPLTIPVALFILVSIISLTNALNWERSITVLAFIVFTMLLAFIVPALLKDKSALEKVVYVLLISSLFVSVFGLFQFFGDMVGLPTTVTGLRELYTKDVLGFPRIQSTAYEPLYFANYLLIPLALALSLFLTKREKMKAGLLLFVFVVGTASFVLTISRGGYLAFIAMTFIISLFYFRKVFTLRNTLIFAVVVVLVWWFVVKALGFGGDLFNLDTFKEHVGNVFYGPSFNERIYTFEQAQVAYQEHPLIGVGVGGFGPYTAPHPYYMPKDGWKIVNNEFIEILAETGILGLVSFLLIVLVLVVRSIKAMLKTQDSYLKAVMIALLAAFIGVLVQYQTFSTLYIMHVWFLVGLMVAVQNIILGGATLRVSPSHASLSTSDVKV